MPFPAVGTDAVDREPLSGLAVPLALLTQVPHHGQAALGADDVVGRALSTAVDADAGHGTEAIVSLITAFKTGLLPPQWQWRSPHRSQRKPF